MAQANKLVKSVYEINISNIFTLLHKKAIKEAAKDFTIQNSAISNKDEFKGPGHHIVAAIPINGEKGPQIKEAAIKALATYVSWFVGPDFAKNINADNVWPLEGESAENTESDKKELKKSTLTASLETPFPSFYKYITEEGTEPTEDPTTDTDAADDTTKSGTATKTDTDDSSKPATTTKDDDKSDGKEEDIEANAGGYYITYEIEIAGQQPTALKDALKDFTKSMLDNVGFRTIRLSGGATGDIYTLGDLKNALDAVFGKLDPNKLKSSVGTEMGKKFPQSNPNVAVWDKNTIIQNLKPHLDSASTGKIKQADLALCIRVNADDKSKKLINTSVIADIITRSISGLYKKFKNKVNKNDVIFVNNYNDNKSDTKTDKLKPVNEASTDEKTKVDPAEIRSKIATITNNIVKAELDKIEGTTYNSEVLTTEETTNKLKSDYSAEYKVDANKYDSSICIEITDIKQDSAAISESSITNISNLLCEKLFDKLLVESKDFTDADIKPIFDKILDACKNDTNIKQLNLVGDVISVSKEETNTDEKTTTNEEQAIATDIFNLIFEDDIVIEKDSDAKSIEDIRKEVSAKINDASNKVILTMQAPYTVDDASVIDGATLAKQLADDDIDDKNIIDIVKQFNANLVIKLAKPTGSLNKVDDIDDEDDETLSGGESLHNISTGNIITEAGGNINFNKIIEAIKTELLKVIDEYKDNFKGNDSNDIYNTLYENLTESLHTTGKLVYESLLTEGHAEEYNQVLSELTRAGLENFVTNIQDIRQKYDAEIAAIKKDNPKNSYIQRNDFGKVYKKEFMPSDAAEKFKSLDAAKSAFKTAFNSAAQGNDVDRNGKTSNETYEMRAIVNALKTLPDDENNKEITITFKTKDPTKEDSDYQEIDKITGKPGQINKDDFKDITDLVADDKPEGYVFDGWDPDPLEMAETGDTVAKFKKDGNITITFTDKDPTDKNSKPEELDKIKGKPGEFKDTDYPDPQDFADYDGYEFDKWDPTPNDLVDDGNVVATYKRNKFVITFIDVDPADPDNESSQKEIDKQTVSDASDIKEPKLPEHDKYVFDDWNPPLANIVRDGLTDDITIKATYKLDDISVVFQDKDPANKDAKPTDIKIVEAQPGEFTTENMPTSPEHDGYKFKNWNPDPNSLETDGEVVAEYIKIEKDKILITFIDRDPNGQQSDKEITTVEKIEGEELKLPDPPSHAGYEFDKWDPDPNNIDKSGKTIAIYKEKDETTDDDNDKPYKYIILPKNLEDVKELPTLSKLFALPFNTTNPDTQLNKVDSNRGQYHFYIVPMKGLKFKSNTDTVQSK